MSHAVARALQRVPGVCPGLLVKGCLWAIKNNRHDILEFVEWQGPDKGVWRGRSSTGQPFRFVANPVLCLPITVMGDWQRNSKKKRHTK